MTGDVVVCEVDALTYIVLSKAEKQAHCGNVFGITDCIAL